MNPPVIDSEGHPYPERRHEVRRDSDVDPTTARGFAFWTRLMMVHKGPLIAALTMAATVGGYAVGVLGLGARVGKLEAAVTVSAARIERLEHSDEFKTYLLCVLVRKTDPQAAPPECGPIIQAKATP